MKTSHVLAAILFLGTLVLLSASRSQESPLARHNLLSLMRPGDYVRSTPGELPVRLVVYSAEEAEEIESEGTNQLGLYEVTSVGADYVGLSHLQRTREESGASRELCISIWSIATVSRYRPDRVR